MTPPGGGGYEAEPINDATHPSNIINRNIFRARACGVRTRQSL